MKSNRLRKVSIFRLIILEYDIKHITEIVISSLAISLLMFADNGNCIYYALVDQEASIYLCFFNTIVYTGMFGTYLASILTAIPHARSYLYEKRAGSSETLIYRCGIQKYAISRFLSSITSGGLCLALAYSIFIFILALRVPFVSEQDMISGLDYFPYVEMSYEGNAWIHIILIIYYGFLTGLLLNAPAVLASAFTDNDFLIISTPFVMKFLLVQIFRILGVPVNFRFDYWLYMRRIYLSYFCTFILTNIFVIVMISLAGAIFVIKLKGGLRSA